MKTKFLFYIKAKVLSIFFFENHFINLSQKRAAYI